METLSEIEVAVIGAGQAGLAASYHLTQRDIPHVVLERGRIGESWRSQRWDSFHLNTPGWASSLAGMEIDSGRSDAFLHRGELVSYFERYAASFAVPVRPQAEVTLVERMPDGYRLRVNDEMWHARAVIVASGCMSRPRVPAMAQHLPIDVTSMPAASYRNPDALREGAVLVVGSGQSGCQITEELLEAGRRVYLCVSRVGRIPRRYRGREILVWWRDMGFLDGHVDELEDPAQQFAPAPQVSGVDGGHTVSLQSLACDGARLLGRLQHVEGPILTIGRDLHESISFANEKARACKAEVDKYIKRLGIEAPAPAPDPGEPPLPDLGGSDLLSSIDLRQAGISSVIWCTGFDADWDWLKVDVFDASGRPRHQDGITASPGLYFLGLTWLSRRSSGILFGVSQDAERIVRHIEHTFTPA